MHICIHIYICIPINIYNYANIIINEDNNKS